MSHTVLSTTTWESLGAVSRARYALPIRVLRAKLRPGVLCVGRMSSSCHVQLPGIDLPTSNRRFKYSRTTLPAELAGSGCLL
eukprot:scaffold20504_cov47-Prasinocladus_malaysianus.AAC.2